MTILKFKSGKEITLRKIDSAGELLEEFVALSIRAGNLQKIEKMVKKAKAQNVDDDYWDKLNSIQIQQAKQALKFRKEVIRAIARCSANGTTEADIESEIPLLDKGEFKRINEEFFAHFNAYLPAEEVVKNSKRE